MEATRVTPPPIMFESKIACDNFWSAKNWMRESVRFEDLHVLEILNCEGCEAKVEEVEFEELLV